MSGSTAKPLRSSVIGCGAIAYEHMPYLAKSARSEFVAVCDQSRALAEAAGDRFGAASIYTDSSRMLAECGPDIVHILTPPHTHGALVREALIAGAHVICEKPMTGSAEETADLLALAKAEGRTLMESRNYLFNDTVMKLRTMIADDRLGAVMECDLLLSLNFLAGPFGDSNLRGPAIALRGGAIHDFLPHLAYLFLMLTGLGNADGALVRGFLTNRSGNLRAGFDYLDVLVDTGRARGRLHISSDVQPDMFRVVLRGTKSTVEADLFHPFVIFHGPPNVGIRSPIGQVANGFCLARAGLKNFYDKVKQHGTYHGVPRMLDAIYRAIQHDEGMPFSDEEILATARLIDSFLDLGKPG